MSKKVYDQRLENKKSNSSKRKFKIGDIVLVKSPAGDCIPNIHVRLLKRVVVNPTKGRYVGIRKTMDWPGYSGWEATPVFQEEIDYLNKEWSIPLTQPGEDITFVFDRLIIKKPRKPQPNPITLKVRKKVRKKARKKVRKPM